MPKAPRSPNLLATRFVALIGPWPKLTRYVGNGHGPISNNLCENAIRPFVVGRKGWLLSDTVASA